MRLFAILSVLSLTAAPCFGDGVLSYTLDPAVYTALPGDAVSVVATLSNVGNATLYLNDYSLVLNGLANTYISEDTVDFDFYNINATYLTTDPPLTTTLDEFNVAANTPNGVYTGTIELVGGDAEYPSDDDFTANNLGTQMFTIDVGSAAPEPGSVGLTALGLAALAAVRIRLSGFRRANRDS